MANQNVKSSGFGGSQDYSGGTPNWDALLTSIQHVCSDPVQFVSNLQTFLNNYDPATPIVIQGQIGSVMPTTMPSSELTTVGSQGRTIANKDF